MAVNKASDTLFKLLQSALWGNTFDVDNASCLEKVLHIAEEQTVVGLVFEEIAKHNIKINQEELFEYIGLTQTIRQENQVVNNVLVEFVRAIKKSDVDYLVVKGQTLASLYPDPFLRMSGDIDYLINSDYKFAKAKIEAAQSIELPSKLLEREIAYDWKDVVFELHTSLIDFSCKKHQQYWDQLVLDNWQNRSTIDIEGVKVYTLPPTLNTVYLFLHLFTHFSKVGISLRQFCDWAVFLRHYEKEIDRCKVQKILQELGLQKAYAAFGAVLVDKLGLLEETFPVKIDESHRKWTANILDDIFRGGNFGRMNHKSNHPWLFKLESVGFALRNTFRYFRLAPSEMGMMIPRMILINLKLILG